MEMAHPLNSGDSRDAILSVDDLIGVLIMTIVWPDPDNPDTWYETVILGDDYPMSFQSYQIK